MNIRKCTPLPTCHAGVAPDSQRLEAEQIQIERDRLRVVRGDREVTRVFQRHQAFLLGRLGRRAGGALRPDPPQ